jgi:hypothetical protein
MIAHLAVLLALSSGSGESSVGTCSLRLTPSRDTLAMRLDYVDPDRTQRNGGADIKKAASFFGVDPSELITRGQSIVGKVQEDSGTFRCVARTTGSGAKGALYFDGNQSYVERMQRLSMSFSRTLTYDLMTAAVAGVTIEYADAIAKEQYHLSVQELAAFRLLHVTPEYLRSLRHATSRAFTPKEIEELSVTGVDGAYISSLAAVGYADLSATQLMELKSVKITATYVRALQSRGLHHPTVSQLLQLKVSE